MTEATTKAVDVEVAHEFRLPEVPLASAIERVVRLIGVVCAWLWFILLAIIMVQVVLRYVFNEGSILLEEVQWHIFGVGIIIGISHALVEDRHVRVDVVAEHLRPRLRAFIEIVGLACFLLPFSIAIMIEAVPFVQFSYATNEISSAPDGLPFRWIPKSFIVIGFALLTLAGFARLLRAFALLRHGPQPVQA